MAEIAILFLAACGTALATGLGAIPVFLLGSRAKALTPFLLGFAAGVMGVASFAGLLAPALEEGSVAEVLAGLAIGVSFLALARRRIGPESGFMGRTGPGARTSGWSSSSSLSTACPRGSPSAPPSPPTAPASASS